MKFTFDPDMGFDNTNQAVQLIVEQDEPLDALMEVMRCNIINDEYGFAAELIRTYGELK